MMHINQALRNYVLNHPKSPRLARDCSDNTIRMYIARYMATGDLQPHEYTELALKDIFERPRPARWRSYF